MSSPDTPREEQVRMDEKALEHAVREFDRADTALFGTPVPEAPEGVVAWGVFGPDRRLICAFESERAAWAEQATLLAEDGEDYRVYPLFTHPLPPSDAPSGTCHYCKCDAVLVKKRERHQWGGARGELPFFYEADDEHWLCASCGEEWYTVEQSRRLDSQCLHAITDAWRKLATPASPSQDAGRRGEVEKLLNRLRAAIDPKDDDYTEPLIQRLLALYGVPASQLSEMLTAALDERDKALLNALRWMYFQSNATIYTDEDGDVGVSLSFGSPEDIECLTEAERATFREGNPRDAEMPDLCARLIDDARGDTTNVPASSGAREGTRAGETERLYHELLYEVQNKVPNETRHETARRIIHQHENQQNNTPQSATPPSPSAGEKP